MATDTLHGKAQTQHTQQIGIFNIYGNSTSRHGLRRFHPELKPEAEHREPSILHLDIYRMESRQPYVLTSCKKQLPSRLPAAEYSGVPEALLRTELGSILRC